MKKLGLIVVLALLLSCGEGLRDPDPVVVPIQTNITNTTNYINAFADVFPSTMMRTAGSALKTLKDEQNFGATLPTGYAEVTSTATHTEGVANPAGHTAGVCGATGTVAEKIANCASTFGTEATWDGETEGRMGQGRWSLVYRGADSSGALVETWKDLRTGLLWSDILDSNGRGNSGIEDFSWCHASGSGSTVGGSVCNGNNVNKCTDAPSTADIDEAKGLLGTSDGVHWRLPTLGDYKVADLNGLKFIFNNWGASTDYYWTSSLHSIAAASEVWLLSGHFGYATLDSSAQSSRVRCVGRYQP